MVTDAELAYSRQSCASYREGPCHNIHALCTQMECQDFRSRKCFYGLRLGVDEGLQMVEIDRKKIISCITEREKQFSVAGVVCALIMLSWWL